MFRKNVFGQLIIFKKLIYLLSGLFIFHKLNLINRIQIKGTENLSGLQKRNVLFVSNHQTYFMDVIAIYSVFSSIKWGFKNKISNPVYLLNANTDTFYVAAAETMKSNLMSKFFSYAGAVMVKRSWREGGKEIKREVDLEGFHQIGKALSDGWVITFPQGTTTPGAPGRIGTAHIIKKFKPLIIPVVIDNFNQAFDKTGLKIKEKGTNLSLRFKPLLNIDYDAEPALILEQVMDAIEQNNSGRI